MKDYEYEVSFIVPAYNCESYIERCINSIFSCYGKKIECILIDDGSTDKTFEVCNKLKNRYSNLTVFHQSNRGVSFSRNIGIIKSKGDYISFVDADDFVQPTDLSFIKDFDVYILNMNFNGLWNDYKGVLKCTDEYKFINYPEYMHSVCNKFFKKDLLIRNNIYFNEEIKYLEDLLFVMRLFVITNKIKYVNKNYYTYWKNDNSASNKIATNQTIENSIKSEQEIEKLLKNTKQANQYKNLIKKLRIFTSYAYLIELSVFNPQKYRINVKKDDIWTFRIHRRAFIITILAHLKMDKCLYLLAKIKHEIRYKK